MLGQWDSNVQMKESGPLSYIIQKNIFKMDIRSKCKTWNQNIQEDNTVYHLFDTGHSKLFLCMSPMMREAKK